MDIQHHTLPRENKLLPNATSRNPVQAEEDNAETAFLAANLAAIAITIDDVASAAKDDNAYRKTYLALSAGDMPLPSKCKEYH